jgi:hypothetical protein
LSSARKISVTFFLLISLASLITLIILFIRMHKEHDGQVQAMSDERRRSVLSQDQFARLKQDQASWTESRAAVDIHMSQLTLASLDSILGDHFDIPGSATGEIGAGWGCISWNNERHCAVDAGFLATGKTAPKERVPARFSIGGHDLWASAFRGTIEGIRLGDPEDKVIALGRRAGYKPQMNGPGSTFSGGRIKWNSLWEASWTSEAGNLASLTLYNSHYQYHY